MESYVCENVIRNDRICENPWDSERMDRCQSIHLQDNDNADPRALYQHDKTTSFLGPHIDARRARMLAEVLDRVDRARVPAEPTRSKLMHRRKFIHTTYKTYHRSVM